MPLKHLLPAAMALAAPAVAQAQDTLAMDAARFGALETVGDISLSPDGTKVAYTSTVGTIGVIYIADLIAGGTPRAIFRVDPKDGRLSWCNWASETRLVCKTRGIVSGDGRLLGYSRGIALNSDGSKATGIDVEANARSLGAMQFGGNVLDWDVAEKPGSVLMGRSYVPERTIGSRTASELEGYGVELVDTLTLQRRNIEQPRKNANQYISDGHGIVRIMGIQGSTNEGYVKPKVEYSYRKAGSRDWEPLTTGEYIDGRYAGFDPYSVDSTRNVVYGFEVINGFTTLRSIALDGTLTRQTVLARAGIDVDGLVTIGRDNRVVGASYATERRLVDYFDPELKRLSAALGKALPGGNTVDIIDASRGETRLLVRASSDTNPGMIYIYDKAAKKLEEVLPVRAPLRSVTLAAMKPVTYTAADGTAIPAYLTLPPGSRGKDIPALVMPHGGPGARDEWGFDWLVQFFAVRGFAVLQPNFRGSAGYGADWYQKNGFKSWRTAIGDVNDAGRWLVSQGIANPQKLGTFGWSYGGYAALQSSVLDPDLFKAIVAVAPVTDLERLRQESRDFTNFPIVDAYIGTGPHISQGSPARNADRIKAPVLMFHGDLDQNVGIGQSRLMAERLKQAGKSAELTEFPGLDHQLRSSEARARMLSASDAFLRKHLGLAPK